ncbi:MAG: hypothetical protein RLY57_614 [Candidatus Parcubacteria bacterium]|jgi:hypothetical protein
MKKGYLLVITLSLLITGVFSLVHTTQALTAPYGFIFLYDMKQGTTLTDVKYLQEILNSDSRTQVTDTGFGSPGNETTYFGEKTKNAVIRFQELYASDILTPNNLAVGTGFVGQSTRNKLNSLIETINGNNSTENNSTNSSDSESTQEKPSKQKTKVSGDTKTSIFTDNDINSSNPQRPTLTDISPLKVSKPTQKITLTGTNFSTVNNVLYGTIGDMKYATSTDGTSITFSLNDFSGFSQAKDLYAGYTINIYIKVQNANGLSDTYAVVSYAFPAQAHNTAQNEIYIDTTTCTTCAANQATANQIETEQAKIAAENKKKSESASSQSKSSGITSSIADIDKLMWALSPQGLIIRLIGGDKAFDTVYQYSPSGMLLGGGSSSGGAYGAVFGGAAGGSSAGGGGGAGGTSGGTGNIDFFGGNITQVTYCTCSAGVLLYIQDKVTNSQKQLVYQYGSSQLRANYNVFSTGPNVIGGFYQGGICEVYSGNSCSSEGSPQGTIDYIRGIGTSLE